MNESPSQKPIDKGWIKRDWERFKASAVSTKAQTLSALVSAASLVVIAAQYLDNNRLVAITERQMLIAARATESGSPNIRAFTVSTILPYAREHHETLLSICEILGEQQRRM